jgi:hypothetical protein
MAMVLGELSWLQRSHEPWLSSGAALWPTPQSRERGHLLARAHVGPNHIHSEFHGGLQLCNHGAQVHLPLPRITPLERGKVVMMHGAK